MGKKKVKKTATANLYRVKRECYIGKRRYHRGDRVAIDVENDGIPPHHFEPLDGGPVGQTPGEVLLKYRGEGSTYRYRRFQLYPR